MGLHRAEVQRRRRPPPTTTTTTTIEAATASAWADAGRFGCFPARLRLSPLVTLQHLHSPFATVSAYVCDVVWVMWVMWVMRVSSENYLSFLPLDRGHRGSSD